MIYLVLDFLLKMFFSFTFITFITFNYFILCFKKDLKPSHVVDHIHFPDNIKEIISERHALCKKHQLTIPTILIVVIEMPKYSPPNPFWQKVYDGESINMIFLCVLSKQFIINGGNKDPSHGLWAKVVAGEEEDIRER